MLEIVTDGGSKWKVEFQADERGVFRACGNISVTVQ